MVGVNARLFSYRKNIDLLEQGRGLYGLDYNAHFQVILCTILKTQSQPTPNIQASCLIV
jgi:hypothetical protein